mgnify:CR=1 FL=1
MRSRFPHGGEVLGAAPANPILAPVLSQDRGLSMSRQQDLLDLQAIQRIPGLVGYWQRDPQYMFEDSAGTTPASTSGTGPVGQWRAVGVTPTLTAVTVANSGFDADSDWTKGTGWTIGSGVATKTAGSAASLSQAITLTAGSVYLITWTLTRTAGTLLPRFTGGSTVSGTALSASGTYTENLVAVTGNVTLEFYGDASFAGTVDDVSVVLLTGVVAVEATTALKPILRKTPTTGVYWADSNTSTSALNVALSDTVLGRRNLLTYTEDFSNAAWSRTGFLSFGSGSIADALPSTVGPAALDLIIEDTNNVPHRAGQFPAVSTIIGTPINITVYVKQGPGSRYFGCQSLTAAGTYAHCVFDLSIKTYNANALIDSASITELPGGIFRLSIKCTPSAILPNSYAYFYLTTSATAVATTGTSPSYVGDGTSGFYIGGAQLEFGSVATDYQKITNVPAYCTLVRATAEGVTFTDNAEIAAPYNIAPAFSFNADVAIFNRALTATEKALITRYMARAVPMLGSNLVTNGTFDTDTVWTKGTGWSIGSGVASKSAGTASNLTQSVGVSGNTYYAKADAVVTAGTIGAYPGSGTTQFGSTSATGTLAYTMKASGTGIGVRGDASFAGNVDNATIKEIL